MTNLFAQAINFDDADRTAKIIQDALYRFVSREARKPTTNLSQMRDAAMAISRFPQYFPLRFCRLDNCSKQIATRQTVNSPALIAHIRFIKTQELPGSALCVDEKPSIQPLERAQGYFKLPNGRASAWHYDFVRSARSRHQKDHRGAFQAAPSCGVPRLHEQPRCRLPGS